VTAIIAALEAPSGRPRLTAGAPGFGRVWLNRQFEHARLVGYCGYARDRRRFGFDLDWPEQRHRVCRIEWVRFDECG
jgi:hypothetical protein